MQKFKSWYFDVNWRVLWNLNWSNHSSLNVDGSTLWLAYMLKQVLGSSIMENSEARMSKKCGERRDYFIMTLSPIHLVPVQDKGLKVLSGKLGAVKITPSDRLHQEYLTINLGSTDDSCSGHLWGSVRDGRADAGQQEQPGGEAGTLANLLTHSVSHCQFTFQTLQQLVRTVLYLGCKGQRAV